MEFDFTFKLNDGAELIINAECTEDDTLIIGIACPDGCLSAKRLMEAYLDFGAIERRTRETYGERMAEIAAERRDAGIAGEGEGAA